jgi:hypothetical protein
MQTITPKTTQLGSVLCCVLLVMIMMIGCQKRYLRGKAEPSKDRQAYLVIEDDNGGACGSMFVDGKLWPYKTHVQGPIAPGPHVIICGSEIEFDIPPATIFHFDYWGP